jgi:hypothetical protein
MFCKCHVCRSSRRQALWLAPALFFAIMGIGYAAYQPGFLIPSNNLSDVTVVATARTNLGLGTAAVKAASNAADATLASVTGSYVVGHVSTFADTSGSLADGGAASVAPTVALAATSAGITLASTPNLTTIVSNTTVTSATLPSAVTVGAGFRECVKDGTEDFNAHPVTLKSTAGSIDGVAAATGIVMNQTHQEMCAISDGTNWFVE